MNTSTKILKSTTVFNCDNQKLAY